MEAPSWPDWDKAHLNYGRLEARQGATICGWVTLTSVSSRCVYAGVAEVSIYINPDYWSQQVGSRLMEALIQESEQHQIWTLQSSIFPENTASIRLNEKYGFCQMGYRQRIAKHPGLWRDVTLLERSQVVGID